MKESDKSSQDRLSTIEDATEKKTIRSQSMSSGERQKRENASITSPPAKAGSPRGGGIKKTTTTRRGTGKSPAKVTAKKIAAEKAQGVEPSPKKTTAKRSVSKTPTSGKQERPSITDAIDDLNSDQAALHPIRIWPD
jgi:hypothetical protein